MDLTEEERKFIEDDYLKQTIKQNNNNRDIEKLQQDKEYQESLLRDRMKEIIIKRRLEFENIISSIKFEPRNILLKDDEKLLRIPFHLLNDNDRIRRKFIDETFYNIKNGTEFINYNKYLSQISGKDFSLNGKFVSFKNLYISKVIFDENIDLVDYIFIYNDKEYRLPLSVDDSSESIGHILTSECPYTSTNLYPEITDIVNKIFIIKAQLR